MRSHDGGRGRKRLIKLRPQAWSWTVAAVLAVAGVAVQLYATHHGAGVSPDSTVYIGAARNLIQGAGLQYLGDSGKLIPLALWQPLYPILLSAGSLVGVDPWLFGRFLNALLIGANLMLFECLVWRATGGRWISAWCASAILIASPAFIEVHSWIWTEPATLFAGFCGLGLLDAFLVSRRRSFLVLAGLMVSAAIMCRYAAVAFLIAGAGVLLLPLAGARAGRRVQNGLIFSAIGLLPMALWMMRNALLAGSAFNRLVEVNTAILPVIVVDGFGVLIDWLSPGRLPQLVRSLLTLGVLGIWLFLAARGMRAHIAELHSNIGRRSYLPELLVGFLLAHLIPIVAVNIFFSPGVHVDERVLLPAYVAGVSLSVVLLARFFTLSLFRWGGRSDIWLSATWAGLIGIFAAAALIIYMNGVHTLDLVSGYHRDGIGYATSDWQASPIINYLRTHTEQVLLMSNGPDIIYFLTGRQAMMLPGTSEEISRAAKEYVDHPDCEIDPVWIIYFRERLRRFEVPSERAIAASLRLRPVFGNDTGSIYCILAGPK
jgi:hypothetical protein